MLGGSQDEPHFYMQVYLAQWQKYKTTLSTDKAVNSAPLVGQICPGQHSEGSQNSVSALVELCAQDPACQGLNLPLQQDHLQNCAKQNCS